MWANVVGKFRPNEIGKKSRKDKLQNKVVLVQINPSVNKSFIQSYLILSRIREDPFNPILKEKRKLYLFLPINTSL